MKDQFIYINLRGVDKVTEKTRKTRDWKADAGGWE